MLVRPQPCTPHLAQTMTQTPRTQAPKAGGLAYPASLFMWVQSMLGAHGT